MSFDHHHHEPTSFSNGQPLDDIDSQEMIGYLKQSRALSGFPDKLLEQLVPLSFRYFFSAGETVLQEQVENHQVFILIKGAVAIYSHGEFIVKLKRRGDIFGELSVITGELSSASVIADTPVEVLGIKARHIGQYGLLAAESLENNFFRLFSRILAEKLALTTQKARLFEITNRQLMETQSAIQEAHAEALRALQVKSAFLAMMSHEIRTPLNSIIGNTELLYYTQLDEQQRKYTETVHRSGELLLATVNNILDFSAIEAGRLPIAHQPFDLRETLTRTKDMFEVKADQKGIQLEVRFSEQLADRYYGDRDRLLQVLINLVGNAIKFTDKGRVVLTVDHVETTADGDRLLFEVQDTGIGIPAESQAMVFEMFSQVDNSTTRRFGGTGLGLAICRNLVELMGGRIELESREGEGSSFHFQLYLKPAGSSVKPV
jgi:signal transduction histidine kinase